MELDNVAAAAAPVTSAPAAAPLLSRRVPLCSYSPPSLAGAPTALLRGGEAIVLASAAEKMGDWGCGFGGWLVVDEEEAGDKARRRRRRAAEAASSSSPSDLSFPGSLPLPTAQLQSTHELAGHGLRSAVAARDAAFSAEYSLFLSETKGKSSAAAGTAAAAASASALLTRESVVAGRRVPLAKLFRVVQRLGGYGRVAEGKRAWRDVLRAFEVIFFLLLRRKGKKTDGGKPRRPKERNCGQGGQSEGIERIGGSSPPCSGGRSRASDEPSSRLPKAAAAQKAREQQQFFFLFPPFFFSPRSFLFVSFTPRPSNRSRTRNPATPSTPCARSG